MCVIVEKGKVVDINIVLSSILKSYMPFTHDVCGHLKQNAQLLANQGNLARVGPISYSAAKSGVSNFTRWLAVYFAKTGIRVNAIAPGFFSTAQNAKLLWNNDGTPTERTKKIINATPMGKFGLPEELIGSVLFLLDDKSSGFISGIVLPIDGGFSAYSGV